MEITLVNWRFEKYLPSDERKGLKQNPHKLKAIQSPISPYAFANLFTFNNLAASPGFEPVIYWNGLTNDLTRVS